MEEEQVTTTELITKIGLQTIRIDKYRMKIALQQANIRQLEDRITVLEKQLDVDSPDAVDGTDGNVEGS